MQLKKNWAENYDLDAHQINKVKQQLDQYDIGARKKREERKSQKKEVKPTKRTPNLTDKEDSPRVGNGNLALEDIIASFHKELRYQRDMIENIKSSVSSLRVQIGEEAEQSQALTNKLQSEIANIRSEALEDQQERKNTYILLDMIQNPKHEKESSKHDKHEKPNQSIPVNQKKKKTCQRT